MFNQASGLYSEQHQKERTVQETNCEEDIEQSYQGLGKSSESLPPAPNAAGIRYQPRQAAFVG